MKRTAAMSLVALGAVGLFASAPARADDEKTVLPPGSVTWRYECKNNDCPLKCTLGGNELFSTGTFSTLTLMQLPDHGYWFRITTEQSSVDYVYLAQARQADAVMCTVGGATLTSLRSGDAAAATQKP